MNKIYRRLWSTARQCWVVASELATAGKASGARRSACIAALPLALGASLLVPQTAGATIFWGCDKENGLRTCFPFIGHDGEFKGASATMASSYYMIMGNATYVNGTYVTGYGHQVRIDGSEGTGFGYGVNVHGDSSTAIGHRAEALRGYSTVLGARASADGIGAVSIGNRSLSSGDNGIAVGSNARNASGAGNSRIAIGGNSYAGSSGYTGAGALGGESRAEYDGTALGHAAKATAVRAQAVGRNATASHTDSVALGANSITTGTNQISVGNNSQKRKIVNLADGALNASSGEAVTGRQLYATSRMVTQNSASGGMRIGVDNSGDQIGIANSRGEARYLNGVRNGTLSSTSTDAVNGQQLLATNQAISAVSQRMDSASRVTATGNVVSEANKAKASGNLALALGQRADATGNAALGVGHAAISAGDNSIAMGSASGASAAFAVALGGNAKANHENSVALGEKSVTTGAQQVSVGSATMKRRIVNVDDGAINASSSDAVTGRQLFGTNERVEASEAVLAAHTGDLAAHSGRIADNRRDLDSLRAEFEDFDPDLDGVVKFAVDGSVDVAGGTLRNVAAGDISSAASTDAVNGGQLFDTNRRVEAMEVLGQFVSIATNEFSENASAGDFSVAIGDSAEAGSSSEVAATAVGSFARALGTGSVALGSSAFVEQSSENGFALGGGASVYSKNGSAIGASAKVESGAEFAVALGSGSVASEQQVVSVGNTGLKRRIINVGRGRDEHDASTVGQLVDSLSVFGGGAGINPNGDIVSPTYNVQGGTQSNVGDALAALDSAVVTSNDRVENLEGKLRSAFQDGPSMRADGLNQLVLAGANGSVLTNLADGRIAAGSRDAVTGSQLFEAKQEIARNRNDLNDLRGERDGLLSRGLMAAEQGNVIDYGGARLTGVADGVISADSRDVVNGRQLNQTNEVVARLERSSNSIAIYSDYESKAAQAGFLGVAVGSDAKSLGIGSTAIGSYATAESTNSAAIGRGAWVGADGAYGIAVGSSTHVEAIYGMALGVGSRVMRGADRSVSLGAESVALEANTLSIGNDYLKRRIVNVANGRNATDAATVGQLRGALSTLGGDIDANGNIINPTFNIQGGQQSTLNEALSTLDAAVVTNTNRTDRVESKLNAVFQDSPTVRNDDLNQLTFAGANGMVLSNVADGVVAAGSRDAVNGGQLHSMQEQLNGRMDGLENRIDGQPQSRAMTVASAGADTPNPEDTPPSTGGNPPLADAGNAPKSSPQPQAETPKPEAPTPQVDTAELEKMLARANEYSDGISREVDRRLDKMDKRFNRMAAMGSAQSAMAMNTAGLNTYNRLGAGVGYSEGESAMAVGYQRVLNDKGSATFSLNGAFTNSGERTMGVGVGIGW